MSAVIYLHPIAQQRHLLETVSMLRSRNYVVPDQPGKRFARAYPQSQIEAIDDVRFTIGMKTLFANWIKFKETK